MAGIALLRSEPGLQDGVRSANNHAFSGIPVVPPETYFRKIFMARSGVKFAA